MPEKSTKKKSNMSFILLLGGLSLLFAGGYYAYTTYFQEGGTTEVSAELPKQFSLKKVDWQKEIFSSDVYKSLITNVPLQITLEVGDVGNDSPFITAQ